MKSSKKRDPFHYRKGISWLASPTMIILGRQFIENQNSILKPKNKFMKNGFLLLATLFLLSSCDPDEQVENEIVPYNIAFSNRVVGVARIEPEAGLVQLAAGESGKIKSIFFLENDTVRVGQPLILLENELEEFQASEYLYRQKAAESALRFEEKKKEEIEIRFLEAKSSLDRSQKLFLGKSLTQEQLDEEKLAVDRLVKELQAAEELLSQRLAEWESSKVLTAYYQELYQRKSIKATEDGVILDSEINVGEYLSVDAKIADFLPIDELIARTEIDEFYADRIAVGNTAILVSQVTGDTVQWGKVYRISNFLNEKSLFKDQSTELEDRRVMEVKIRLDNGKTPLIGSRMDCIILLD